MKKILITGGAGFIGSFLTKKLLNQNYLITIIDNLERGNISSLKNELDKIKFVNADLRKIDEVEEYFLDQDIVVHLASKVGGIGTYLSDPFNIINSNIQIDSNVFNLCNKFSVKKLIYASSAHIYPKNLQSSPNIPPIKETEAFPADCDLSYGWAKILGEKQLQFLHETNPNLKIAIARFIGIYGPNQDYNLSTGSVIPVFCHRVLKYPETKFTVWGTGEEIRSYCYIDDCINFIEKLIFKLDEINFVGPLNIGKTEKVKISTIAETIKKISGKNIKIEYDTTKETKIWGQWCDCSLAEKILGYTSGTSLEEGLKNVYIDIERRLKL